MPALLTPCSEDIYINKTPAWTPKIIFNPNPINAITILKSNVWPGAYVFACGNITDIIYCGWGQKYSAYCHSPMPIPKILDEYPIGLDIFEINDPTAGEEEEYRLTKEIDEKAKDASDLEDIEEEEDADQP